LSPSTIRQLVREGQWWDRIEEKYLGVAMTASLVLSDVVEVKLLATGQRLLRRRRRLSQRESIVLLSEWRPDLAADIRKWAALPREARLSYAYRQDRQRLIGLLNP